MRSMQLMYLSTGTAIKELAFIQLTINEMFDKSLRTMTMFSCG